MPQSVALYQASWLPKTAALGSSSAAIARTTSTDSLPKSPTNSTRSTPKCLSAIASSASQQLWISPITAILMSDDGAGWAMAARSSAVSLVVRSAALSDRCLVIVCLAIVRLAIV
jgi:predicted RNA-binding Zn ribbon-like protein